MFDKINKQIQEWKANGAWSGITIVPIAFLILSIILLIIWAPSAESGEWFPRGGEPEFSLFIEAPVDSLYCEGGGREFNSDIWFKGTVWRDRAVSIGCKATHHSCGFKKDVDPSDVIGCGISVSPRWW